MSRELEFLLGVIVALLLLIWIELWRVNARLRKQFPTSQEKDQDWAIQDPMGHWKEHKSDK